jgi:TetR/AcrR family transcriptional regulator, lmrAB and yxaGH operons repressor
MFANDSEGFVGALFEAAGKEMETNHWIGCAAQILVQELPPNNQKLRRQLSTVYKRWIQAVAIAIRPDCESETAAEDLATLVIAALNGARTLARGARSQAPFLTSADRIQKTAFGHRD